MVDIMIFPNVYDVIANKQYNYRMENPPMGPLHPFIYLILISPL